MTAQELSAAEAYARSYANHPSPVLRSGALHIQALLKDALVRETAAWGRGYRYGLKDAQHVQHNCPVDRRAREVLERLNPEKELGFIHEMQWILGKAPIDPRERGETIRY